MRPRVIYRHVPEWYGETKDFVRVDLERFLARAGAERYREEIQAASLDRLLSLWHRLPYVRDAEELFTADFSLGIEPLSVRDLLRAGFGRPLQCGLFLELTYSSGQPKRAALRDAVPWLNLLRDPESLITHLRSRGWLLFRCSSPDRAEELQRQVKASLVRCQLLGSVAGSEAL
jgi:hypothetical protein